MSGRARKGPAPLNLEVPVYDFADETNVVIGWSLIVEEEEQEEVEEEEEVAFSGWYRKGRETGGFPLEEKKSISCDL